MRLLAIAKLLSFVMLSACNFGHDALPAATPIENNIIYVTATPPAVEAQAAPTEAASAVPPTPTIEPALLLQLGDNFMRNGYLEDAAGMYRALLDQGPATDSNTRALAAFRLGQVALRDGYFQQAFDAFNQLIIEFPASAFVPQAYFLRGDARLGLAQWGGAVSEFQQYLSLRPGLIDSYVYERIADAQIALGQTDTALLNYEHAINAKRSKVPLLVLREKLASIYINLSRAEDAVAQYDAILAVARNVPYRASIAFAAAQALLDAGIRESGLSRMQQVFDNYSETAVAYDALKYLAAEGVTYDGLQRGKSRLHRRRLRGRNRCLQCLYQLASVGGNPGGITSAVGARLPANRQLRCGHGGVSDGHRPISARSALSVTRYWSGGARDSWLATVRPRFRFISRSRTITIT